MPLWKAPLTCFKQNNYISKKETNLDVNVIAKSVFGQKFGYASVTVITEWTSELITGTTF